MRSIFIIWGVLFVFEVVWSQPAGPKYLGQARPEGVPQRVVSLAPNITEVLFALDIGDRIVGVTRYDDYPQEVQKIPKVGGFVDPSIEAILALRPDLVICTPNSGGKSRLFSISKVGVVVLVLRAYRINDIYASIYFLGKLFNQEEKAKILVGSMQEKIKQISAKVKNHIKPKVLMVYGHRPIVAAGRGSFPDEMINLAGAENVMRHSKVRYPSVPMEEIIRLQPDFIIDASSGGQGAEMSVERTRTKWDRFKVLEAVRVNQVVILDSSVWFRPSPRIVRGLEKLVEILHPRLDLSTPGTINDTE